MQIREFAELVRSGIDRIGQTLASDDDWAPAAHMVTGHGHEVISIDGAFMASPEGKDRLVEMLREVIDARGARLIAYWATAWVTAYRGPDQPLPSQDPARREIVMLSVVSPTAYEVWIGTIARRPGKPPKVSSWDAPGTSASGRFVEPLQQALARYAAKAARRN